MTMYSDVQRMGSIRRRLEITGLFFAIYGFAHFVMDGWWALDNLLQWLAVHL